MDVCVLWSIVQADLNELALESEAGGGGTVPMWMMFHLQTCPVQGVSVLCHLCHVDKSSDRPSLQEAAQEVAARSRISHVLALQRGGKNQVS